MESVFACEWIELPRRLGGARGALALFALIVLGTLPPLRFGFGFLDPLVLLAYASFAMLFAAPFTAQSFAGTIERREIEERDASGPADLDLVLGKVLAATLYGWFAFALILATALFALNLAVPHGRLLLPPSLAGVAVFAFTLAFFTSAAGAVVSLRVFTARAARQMFRLALIFILLLLILVPRFLPLPAKEWFDERLVASELSKSLLVASAVLTLLGLFFVWQATGVAAEKRQRLTIT